MIRDATPADAKALARLWNPWIRDSLITFNSQEKSAEDVAGLIRSRQAQARAFLLAEGEDGALLGFASYDQFRGGPGYARTMEHTVILAPEARGRGIGRRLMSALESHARAAGCHALVGCVSAANPEARAFHTRIGFALWGTLPEVGFKFGRPLDLWIMGKLL